METGKPGLASAPVHINSAAVQTEKKMDIPAPLTAVYIHTVPALPAQSYPQPLATVQEPATLQLAMSPLYSKETLPFLTLQIAGGLQSQPGLSLAAAPPAARQVKSAGKHVCPHCGRDCLKPSVLEKHLRCHTGERPYPCTTCGISFKTQSNLYKHKRTQAHARLSSESEQSSLGSTDSMSNSRETHSSSLSLDEHNEESSSMEKETQQPTAEITHSTSTMKIHSVKKHGSVSEQKELTPAENNTKEPNESRKVMIEGKKPNLENEKPLLTASRHLPLKRQEATLFSKQWEGSTSRGKSQSHESTDSGFSESSDHYPSPGSVLPDHSMDSLTESTKEHLEETMSTQILSDQDQGGRQPKDPSQEQEHKTLEERISKLISENTAVVEDKQLENVRPRKTVLSKQGSIDLPMPYTYKDSFHFDMRINQTQNVGLQRNRKPGFYSSVPTQHSTTMEHAPLTRSNSLPFSVTLLQPERSSQSSSHQSDYVTFVRRRSSGQINSTGFTIKPVTQHSSTHHPLVRQTAVDCNHATDGLFMNSSVNSSVEEACTGSLSCDGDGGDICGEPSNRKFRRKKAQKFAYNKWYMYGGGTFKKLYNAEKGGDSSAIKGRKCSTNPEHEGIAKRLSAIHQEAVATTASTINFTSNSATVCHQDCPAAKMSLVSAVDFNLKTSQPHMSGRTLKSPLQRNLSLSILPLPLIGSLVSHKTDNVDRAEEERLINEEKHTDSSLHLCGAHFPSDRKKQKTDDKIICPLEMKTISNTLTHPTLSVTGSASQHNTNLSYINFQKSLKHTQLFPPSIISANMPSVSTSSAASTPSTAKTTFLPKYQLKLPSAAEPDSNPSQQVVDKPTETADHNFTSAVSSCHTEQTPLSVTALEKKCGDPVPPLLTQSCNIKKANTFSSTQGPLLLPYISTALCQTETSSLNQNATSSLTVVHRQFAATTVTTTCLQYHQAGLCSTSVQPSKSAGDSVLKQLSRPVAPVVSNFPAAPTITTANNQASAATITAFSQIPPKPPLSHTQLSSASEPLTPVNRAYASSNNPVVPCHVIPFDQMQSAAQNVFHVHTADLQICFQIISDEQLALIEPQIEKQAGSTFSQTHDMETASSERIQNKAQSSVTMESTNERGGHQQPGHQKELDQSELMHTLNMDRIKHPMSVLFGKAEPNLHLTEHSNNCQTTESADSKPPEALGLLQGQHKCLHVNTVTENQCTTADVMSTATLLKGVRSGRRQASEEEHALSLNRCAEEQLLPSRGVSHIGLVSQTLSSQHRLSMTSLSSNTVNQNSLRLEILGSESQQKLIYQGTTCTVKAKDAYESSRLESGKIQTHLKVGLCQASSTACADDLSGPVSSFFINKCSDPAQLNPQALIYCSNSGESRVSEDLNSSKHAIMECGMANPTDNSAPLQEMARCESQDVISSAHSGKQLVQFPLVSSNIQVERPTDPAALTSIQCPPAGLMVEDVLEGCAQRDSQTPSQPDSSDWRPKQSQDSEETNHHAMEEESGGGVVGKDKNGGISTDEERGQWRKAESNCKYTRLQDRSKPEGKDKISKEDSFKNSCLLEQPLQHLSQRHSGMSEYPQQSLQQAPSTSSNLQSDSSSNTGLFNSPQPPLEMTNSYFIHNPQTPISCEPNSSQLHKPQAQLTEIQNPFFQIESNPQQTQTFSHQEQKKTSISSKVQQGNTATGPNIAAEESSTHPSQVPCSAEVSRAIAGSTGDPQASNSIVPYNSIALLSKPFTYSKPDDYQDTNDKAPNDYTSKSSNSGRADFSNKYQPFLFAGQLHGYQPVECLTGGVRPVQSCQDYTEDTSSSDDEGKLIIEL